MDRPGSQEYESNLVIAIIHNKRFREYVLSNMTNEMFSVFESQEIFETVQGLRFKKKPITFMGVYESIRRNTKYSDEVATSLCAIIDPFLNNKNPTILNSIVDGVLPIVEETIKGRLVEVALATSIDLSEEEKYDSVMEVWDKVGREAIYQTSPQVSFWQQIEDSQGDIMKMINYHEGIPTGICGQDRSLHNEKLDARMFHKGIGRGQLAILVADSNIGKTTMMLNICVFQSLSGYEVDYYSLEMDLDYIMARMVSILTGIPTDDIIKEGQGKKVLKKLAEVKEKYPKATDINFYHYTPHVLTPSTIAHNLTMSAKEGRAVDSFIVDYVDLMKSERQYRDRRFEIGNNAIELRSIAQEFNACSITPSQTNRGFGNEKKKIKTRQNVAEDYSKIQTSDHVWIVNETTEDDKTYGAEQKKIEVVRLFQDKNRFGRRGLLLTLSPNQETGRFYDCLPKI
jgi:replicative DNA helicase